MRKSVYDRVQLVLKGKYMFGPQRHDHVFRRLFACGVCGNALTGEAHKGHIYYRCHSHGCKGASVREEALDEAIVKALMAIQVTVQEYNYIKTKLFTMKNDWGVENEQRAQALDLRHNQIKERLARLTDAVIDKVIDKEEYETRKASLLLEQCSINDEKAHQKASTSTLGFRVEEFFELVRNLYSGYVSSSKAEKREFVNLVCSNRSVTGKNVVVEPRFPFNYVANRLCVLGGDPYRAGLRTLDEMLDQVIGHLKDNPSLDFSGLWGVGQSVGEEKGEEAA